MATTAEWLPYGPVAYDRDLELTADACVIGTGAGGAVFASELAEGGKSVVMLEKGGFFRAEDFSQREADAMADFNGRRGLDSTKDNSMFLNYAEAVGGCTVHYWGDSFRTPEDRLERWRTQNGIDWMTPEELNPHWDVIEKELGIHIAGPELFNENNRLVKAGCEKLGIDGHAVPTARVDCIACGWTQYGCAYNRKSSQLITTIPRISKAGGRIYSDAQAARIVVENGRAVAVEGDLIDRKTHVAHARIRVDASVIVIAGGGIGGAELLLRNFPDEPVGRRFYVNPHYFVWADMGREIDNQTGIPCAYAVHEFRQVKRNARREYESGGYIMLSNHQSPGVFSVMLAESGPAHTERMKKYRHLGSLMSVIDEDNPGRLYIDRNGIRRTSFHVSGIDQYKAIDYLKNASRIFLAAGAREVWIPDVYGTIVRNEQDIRSKITLRSVEPNAQFCGGSHFLGTAPMGTDTADTFAKPTGESHRTAHLYVCDGSSLPGSISVDPSLTIMGVSRHIAAGLHERFGRSGA